MRQTSLIIFLVLIAGLSRLIPHPWNFTALTAMAVFAGQTLENRKWAWLVPLLSLFWTDLILGFHSTMLFVYLGILVPMLLPKSIKTGPALVVGSLSFFVITNLGVWLVQGMYPMTAQGLIECFTMALPFYKNQILGDLIYTAVLFGVFSQAKKHTFFKQVTA